MDAELRWRLRKAMWDWIFGQLFRAIRVPPLPPPNDQRVEVQSWRQVHGQALDSVMTAVETPVDELSRAKRWVRWAVIKTRRFVPQLQADAPELPPDPPAFMQRVWSRSHARAYDGQPRLLASYRDRLDLGALIEQGPFFGFVSVVDGALAIDLRLFEHFEHHRGVRNLTTLTSLELVEGRLRASAIEHPVEGRRFTPGDAGWGEAVRLVGAGILTHALVLQHLSWSHLSTAGSFALATRNALPKDHPIKALLWPHIHGTLDVNNTLAPGLMQEQPGEGVFGDVLNLTHAGAMALVRHAAERFDIRWQSPHGDRMRRGLQDHPLTCLIEQDAKAIWQILHQHVSRWVELSYADDAALQQDAAIVQFLENLQTYLPNGLRDLVADRAKPRRAELIEVCCRQLYTATVVHEAVGNLTWNYVTWPARVPCRIYPDARLPPADVYQRFFNVLFATNVPNRSLLEDWAQVLPDARYRTLLKTFQDALRARQAQMQTEPARESRLYPEDLEAAIAV